MVRWFAGPGAWPWLYPGHPICVCVFVSVFGNPEGKHELSKLKQTTPNLGGEVRTTHPPRSLGKSLRNRSRSLPWGVPKPEVISLGRFRKLRDSTTSPWPLCQAASGFSTHGCGTGPQTRLLSLQSAPCFCWFLELTYVWGTWPGDVLLAYASNVRMGVGGLRLQGSRAFGHGDLTGNLFFYATIHLIGDSWGPTSMGGKS